MADAVRAIYEHGRLRLLDPVNLAEGQEIALMILSERERARAAFGNLLVQYAPEPEAEPLPNHIPYRRPRRYKH